jgi:hypothetical protein
MLALLLAVDESWFRLQHDDERRAAAAAARRRRAARAKAPQRHFVV